MRALFVCQPAYGHFHPLVPLATACEEAGHDVAFAVAPGFAPVVEAAGFEARAAGLDWLEHAPERTFPETASLSNVELGRFLFNSIFLDHAAASMAGDLPGVARGWGADLLVHECYEFGTPIAAEAAGLPCVTIELGQPPDPTLERYRGGLRLNCWPPPFEVDSWSQLRPLRPVPFDGPTAEAALPIEHGDRPLVLVTFGTVFAERAAAVVDAVTEALSVLDVDVLTALGPEKWVPVGATARQADVVVGHGGWGTTMAALCAGKPSLVLPQGGDQFDNAFRVEATGAGLRLLPHAVNPVTVRSAVHELLDEPLYFANAQRLRRAIEAMPSPAEVVPVLERTAEVA